MIRLFALLLLPFQVLALDVIQGKDVTATCTLQDTYVDGTPVRANDTEVRLYIDGVVAQTSSTCNFTITSPDVGEYILHVTVFSPFFGTESLASNTNDLNVLAPNTPKAPTQFRLQ